MVTSYESTLVSRRPRSVCHLRSRRRLGPRRASRYASRHDDGDDDDDDWIGDQFVLQQLHNDCDSPPYTTAIAGSRRQQDNSGPNKDDGDECHPDRISKFDIEMELRKACHRVLRNYHDGNINRQHNGSQKR